MHVDEDDPEADAAKSKEMLHIDWKKSLPDNAGNVRDISNKAFWTLSSCKTDGFGIQQLLDDNTDHYWQSDGPQPHTVTIEFNRKTDLSFLLLYLDYKTDESYTPSRVVVHLGASILDLDDGLSFVFNEPIGWQVLDLRKKNLKPSRAFVLQFQVVQNHQNGRDTHIRQMRVVGPATSRLDTGLKAFLDGGLDLNNVPMQFTSSKLSSYATLR